MTQNNSRLRFKNGGQTLFIEFVSLDDDAIYTCVIKNKAGEIKASGEIILLGKFILKYVNAVFFFI